MREITKGGAHVSIDALGHPGDLLQLDRQSAPPRAPRAGRADARRARQRRRCRWRKVIAHELEIHGSHGMQAFRYQAMMDMIRTGKLNPQKLVGKHLSLDEAPAALMAMDRFEGLGISVVTRF